MSELLILTIIVSIVLGISLQSAFIGIITFLVGLFLAILAFKTIGFGVSLIKDFREDIKTTEAKPAKQVKQKEADKTSFAGLGVFIVIVLAVVLPVALGVLLADLFNNTALIGVLPPLLFCAELFFLVPLYINKVTNKKHTKKS